MPDVVPAECFLGLPPQERWEQLYWAAGGTLECFLGLDRRSQLEAFLEAVGAETCYGTEEDFWRNWAAVLGVECIPAGLEDVQLAVYTALYDAAGDDTLLPPECFLGAGPDGQWLAFFLLLADGGGGACWILGTGFWRDQCTWIDTETWND